MNFPTLRPLARRSIMLLVSVAMLTLTLITLAGMSASVLVVESARGSASAINVAGSLRRYTHRLANLIAVDALSGRSESQRVEAAVRDFETHLEHPALLRFVERAPGELFAATYRGVHASWHLSLKPRIEALGAQSPPPPNEQVEILLTEVDAFVDQLNTLVAVLEHDTEKRIQDLRLILAGAIALTVLVVGVALALLKRALLTPLRGLLDAARRIAGGDFGVRVSYTGQDELGRVGLAFNLMADELAGHYRTLEQRVADKTSELQRSNRSLELLYHAIARLYQTPTATEAYEATLRDIDRVAGLEGSFVCIEPRHGGPASVIASSMGGCPDRNERGEDACGACRAASDGVGVALHHPALLRFPLRDREHHYGMLRLSLPDGARLEDWQRQLVEALSRHIGMALGASRRSEQERLLALQEERSVIARELHDSLAQALSYMKIQVSLLQGVLADPQRRAEAEPILADLREGINAAYRQLRELLVSFRLGLAGDLKTLLADAVREYGARGGVAVQLEVALGECTLRPNQEVHVLQIAREALSNMVRHAQARRARVSLIGTDDGMVELTVMDDGVGLGMPPADAHNHHGMAIMRERASSLGGSIAFDDQADGGTCLRVRFQAAASLAEPVVSPAPAEAPSHAGESRA
ncbi:MAG TPA: nitrate/nitrite two-component system sensor histidine kinase [Thauera sp.]|nr:nitrate/nitrite two-component system sensor histidine kinase [Thauera sp.]